MEKQRVQKFIAQSGFCSRRKAEELIKQQRVKVNDKLIELGFKCSCDDEIKVDDKMINCEVDFKYIVLNKKKGYVCSKADKFNKKTIYDLIDIQDNSLFSVGRLDKDTTGLIIVTNDGKFAQKIIHPSQKIKKEYIADLNFKLNDSQKKRIEDGVILDGYKLKPCKICLIKNNLYKVIIEEGRKRQIRRMFKEVGLKVVNLERIKIGNLNLGNLQLGKYKEVSKSFLEKQIGIK